MVIAAMIALGLSSIRTIDKVGGLAMVGTLSILTACKHQTCEQQA